MLTILTASTLKIPICKVSIFPILPRAWGDGRAPGKTRLSVLPEMDTLERGHLLSGWEVVQIPSLSTAKGIRAVSGLRRGRKVNVSILPCLTHTHTQSWHTQNQETATAPEPSPGCVATAAPPSNWTAGALLPLAQDAGQALADSSCPRTHPYSHFTEWETEAQAASHRAREQDSEIQVTETGTGQGGPCDQMESEAEGGKGPAEVTC